MVGVPRSKGCDACRLQKKRCVVTGEPPCARCKRLDITCQGYGAKRFTFKAELPDRRGVDNRAAGVSSADAKAVAVASSTVRRRATKRSAVLAGSPISSIDVLVQSLLYCVNDGQLVDPRFCLVSTMAPFLLAVPQYLGSSKPLDSGIDTLINSYALFRRHGHSGMDRNVLSKYTGFLRDLRLALATTEEACSSATLCAIMIAIVIETLVGSPRAMSHAGGAARVLKCRGSRPPKDEFERIVLLTLRGPVVLQALFLEEDYFTPDEWSSISSGFSPSPTDEAAQHWFQIMSGTARLLQRLRKTLKQNEIAPSALDLFQFELGILQHQARNVMQENKAAFASIREAPPSYQETNRVHEWLAVARDYALTLAMQTLQQGLATIFAPGPDYEQDLQTSIWCNDMCNLAEEVTQYRPLGASWASLMLTMGYLGAEDEGDKLRIVALLNEYASDLQGENGTVQQSGLEALTHFVRCRDLIPSGVDGEAVQAALKCLRVGEVESS